MNISSPWHPTRSSERGMVIVYVAILALVLIGLLGLAVDGAFVSSTSQQLQHAADAAALNAVRYINTEADPFPETRAAALAVALANEAAQATIKLDANDANASSGDIVVGYWDHFSQTFTPTVTEPNAVRVRAKRTSANTDGQLSLFFGPLFGKNTSNVGVTSTAVLSSTYPVLVLILDPTGSNALRINGTNDLYVPGGRVHANSDHNCGISLVGTPTMVASRTTVVGGACYPGGTISGGAVVENADVVADPLADVLPTVASWNAFKSSLPMPLGPTGKISATGTYDPGYYPGGLDAASSTAITLNPGSYMFGDDVKLSGSAFVTGSNVTLFMDKDVEVDISGSGAGMQLTPPVEGDPFYGISFFLHRQTTGSSVCKIGGGGAFEVQGIVYVPGGELVMGGTPGKKIGGFIAFRASTDGTTGFIITGEGVPNWGTGPDSAFLVE